MTAPPGGVPVLVVRSVFDSREHMDWLVRMGATEVFARTVGQMDALLAG